MSDLIKTEKVLDLLAGVVAEIIKMPPEEPEKSVLEKPARDLIDKRTVDLILGRTETHDKRTETHACVSPCDICRHYPPSSADGKPCSMCPAEPTEQVRTYVSLADCVSRQAAIKAVCSVCGDTECNIFDPDNKAKLYCPEPYAIMKLPSAEPNESDCWGCNCPKMERMNAEPERRGRWIPHNENAPMFSPSYCSECGAICRNVLDKFCYQCGADMRGEQE